MSTLKDKAQEILNEKDLKIIPENIKDGVQIFDVIGEYQGSGGSIDEYVYDVAEAHLPLGRAIKKLPFRVMNSQNLPLSSLLFLGYSKITNIDFINSSYEPVSKLYGGSSCAGAFAGCNSLISLPPIDLGNTQFASSLFRDCRSLQNIEIVGTFTPENYSTDMDIGYNSVSANGIAEMFRSCASLENIAGNIDLSNCGDASFVFYGCSSLLNCPIIDWSGVTNMSNTFYGCTSLESIDFSTLVVDNLKEFNPDTQQMEIAEWAVADFLTDVNENCNITCSQELADYISSTYPNKFNLIIV
jgi:hypothetical protein